ncbi:hypothetical protein B0H16DRAFT_1453976 [Mycena metata]|uniref:CCHC-type domain-containing protein n=1 Tax=Mycena metata TaxID=1033252 RepID=A0AAD7JJB8_9AGAR|nr:hypothetical protein B0H16DRAFT_1453976 [Mycena metata]
MFSALRLGTVAIAFRGARIQALRLPSVALRPLSTTKTNSRAWTEHLIWQVFESKSILPDPTLWCSQLQLEGHGQRQCREPVICRACGIEGHELRDCPTPDPARIEADYANRKCSRCGEAGHDIRRSPRIRQIDSNLSSVQDHALNRCPTFQAVLAENRAAWEALTEEEKAAKKAAAKATRDAAKAARATLNGSPLQAMSAAKASFKANRAAQRANPALTSAAAQRQFTSRWETRELSSPSFSVPPSNGPEISPVDPAFFEDNLDRAHDLRCVNEHGRKPDPARISLCLPPWREGRSVQACKQRPKCFLCGETCIPGVNSGFGFLIAGYIHSNCNSAARSRPAPGFAVLPSAVGSNNPTYLCEQKKSQRPPSAVGGIEPPSSLTTDVVRRTEQRRPPRSTTALQSIAEIAGEDVSSDELRLGSLCLRAAAAGRPIIFCVSDRNSLLLKHGKNENVLADVSSHLGEQKTLDAVTKCRRGTRAQTPHNRYLANRARATSLVNDGLLGFRAGIAGCGIEGHERKACPKPDPARLETVYTGKLCFRCGELGHGNRDCTQPPPNCYHCNADDHDITQCSTRKAEMAVKQAEWHAEKAAVREAAREAKKADASWAAATDEEQAVRKAVKERAIARRAADRASRQRAATQTADAST